MRNARPQARAGPRVSVCAQAPARVRAQARAQAGTGVRASPTVGVAPSQFCIDFESSLLPGVNYGLEPMLYTTPHSTVLPAFAVMAELAISDANRAMTVPSAEGMRKPSMIARLLAVATDEALLAAGWSYALT